MTPDLLDFLDFLSDIPHDDPLWLLLAQLCAERDELEAAFVKRDRDMIRRMLVMSYPDIACIRGYAKEADALAPRMRRAKIAPHGGKSSRRRCRSACVN